MYVRSWLNEDIFRIDKSNLPNFLKVGTDVTEYQISSILEAWNVIPIGLIIIINKNVNFISLSNMQENMLKPIGVAIAISIAQILYIMNFTSIISISREGKNAKMMKTLPISLYKQFKYKLYPALIGDTFIAFIVTICYSALSRNVNPIFIICLFIILLELCLVQEKIMIIIDLNRPKITWTSEYAMMKENVNVMYEFLYAVIVIILLVGMVFIIKNVVTFMITIFIILLMINLIINQYVKKNQIKLYKKIF